MTFFSSSAVKPTYNSPSVLLCLCSPLHLLSAPPLAGIEPGPQPRLKTKFSWAASSQHQAPFLQLSAEVNSEV